jgi:hypothetical protein
MAIGQCKICMIFGFNPSVLGHSGMRDSRRKQCCGSGYIESRSESGSRVQMIKSWKKLQMKKNLSNLDEKMAIYCTNVLIPGPPKRTSKLQEKPSALKREHPALQQLKFISFFSIFVSHFCLPGSGSGSHRVRIPIESGSNSDPDPDHWM